MVEVFIVEAGDTFQEALGSRVSLFNKGIRSSLSKNNELDRISISGSGGTPPTATGEITTAAAGGSIASNTIAGATGGVVGVFAGNTTDLRVELEAICMHDSLPFIYDIYVSDADTTALIEGGKGLNDELFDRLASQIRTSLTAFIKQSGVPGLDKVQVTSSLSHAEKFFESATISGFV